MHVVDSNAFHRTLTHSILFFIVMSPLLGYLISRIHSSGEARWKDWSWLAFWSLFTHALLDSFTTWGTALFWPLDYKVALQSVFVIDPFYTIPLFLFTLLAIRLPKTDVRRQRLTTIGLVVSTSYLAAGLLCKYTANKHFQSALEASGVSYERFESRPAPLNIILWGVTAETADGYYTGYYSLFDRTREITFHYFPKNHQLLENYSASHRISVLKGMSDGWYTVEALPEREGIVFNDLRFGTNRAWEPGGEFIFSYHIKSMPNKDISITQRERGFEDPPSVILGKLLSRTLGNPVN